MTIDSIRDEIAEHTQFWGKSAEYIQKYFHAVPKTVTIDRIEFILNSCKDKTVLHLGCAGPLHDLVRKVGKEVWGVDIVPQDIPNFLRLDLEKDDLGPLAAHPWDVVLCCEILEHLSNPGTALDNLRKVISAPMIVTLPNAFGVSGISWLQKGFENVNDEHVAYYSYKTAHTLLTRHGWQVEKLFWYNGQPMFSEGLILIVR